MSEENCEICGARIHSINVRSFGSHRWCQFCGDNLMLPALQRFTDGFTEAIKNEIENHGGSVVQYTHFEEHKLRQHIPYR